MPPASLPDPNRRQSVVDTALAALYERRYAAMSELSAAAGRLHRALRERQEVRYIRNTKQSVWPTTTEEAIAAAKSRLASGTGGDYSSRYAAGEMEASLAAISAARVELAAVDEQERPLDAEYDRGRWSRFFMVTSSAGGHIHSSMSCSTCHPTTRYGWLPELSGLTERDAVDAEGPLLCSVCYPSAPTEWTIGIEKTPDPRVCPGSGKQAVYQKGSSFCGVCGAWTRATMMGTARRHFKPSGR